MMQIQKSKPGYKTVRTFFGKKIEIPEGWEWTKVENQFKLKSGSTPSRSHPEYYDGTIPWVSSGELDYNIITDTKEHVNSTAVNKTKLRVYPKRTLLIAITGLEAEGTRGRCAILGVEATTNQSCLAFYESPTVDTFFFFYYYQYYGEKIVFSLAQGTKQQSLNIGLVKSIKFPLPHIEEQKKIASILSNVDSLIQQTQKRIKQTQILKTGLMQNLLTKGIGHTKFKSVNFHFGKIIQIPEEWKVGKLGENASKIGSGVTPKGGSTVYEKNGIPLIRSQNVHFDGLRLANVAYISEEIHNKMRNTQLKPFDVLLNITGASIGRCTFVPANFKEGNVNQHVCIIRPTKNLHHGFLNHLFSINLTQHMINSSQAGLSRQGLNFHELKSFIIPLPSLDEQMQISDIISNVNTNITHLMKYNIHLANIKKGLMQKLLTGQIRVKV